MASLVDKVAKLKEMVTQYENTQDPAAKAEALGRILGFISAL